MQSSQHRQPGPVIRRLVLLLTRPLTSSSGSVGPAGAAVAVGAPIAAIAGLFNWGNWETMAQAFLVALALFLLLLLHAWAITHPMTVAERCGRRSELD